MRCIICGTEYETPFDHRDSDTEYELYRHPKIDRLRDWKESAMRVLSDWDAVWEAAGQPGALGSSKARAVELLIRRTHAAAESAALAWDVLADELEPFAKEVRSVANDLGCTPARALRMLVRYGITRYDEANDIVRYAEGGTVPAGVAWVPHAPDGNDRRPCTCGHPQADGVVHRSDGPCFHVPGGVLP